MKRYNTKKRISRPNLKKAINRIANELDSLYDKTPHLKKSQIQIDIAINALDRAYIRIPSK